VYFSLLMAAPPVKKSFKLNAAVRNACWIRHNTDKGVALCYCCGIEQVTRSNFDAGHVIARAMNGSDELGNLRPICGCCNSSGGTEDMRTFAIRNGLEGRIVGEKPAEPPSSVTSASTELKMLPPAPVLPVTGKVPCHTCRELFTVGTLAKYDGKNCFKCFKMLATLPPQKLRLKKAGLEDVVNVVCCAHCQERNVIVED
jgi:hypothetical protein